MEIIDPGHSYILDHVDDPGMQSLVFIKRSGGAVFYVHEYPGTNVQEVLRALIDRTEYLNSILPCDESENALYHLRMTLFFYEARAYRRKQEEVNRKKPEHESDMSRGHGEERDIPFTEHMIETLPTGPDGHIITE